ncbi:hypothetical protein LPB140_10315 [Sphingorhabdus lutea]|uniref:Uncharacterized protein n=1 Tax=Sphingorhabdus lutea TaxID=1913578 RepID=A0A1L3JD98_9SPHN|nr:hypothetical protein [Sphingorhabdus lutea]APG63111.1 hypothetical protein LPB140_10315 [Sphingorhabdus lutea]
MKPNFFRFLLVVGLILFVSWRVIIPQLDLIEDGWTFGILAIGLLIASFLSSAMEAALSVISRDESLSKEVTKEKSNLLSQHTTMLNQIDGNGKGYTRRRDFYSLAKLRWKHLSLNMKEFSISHDGRGVAVGAFASASVFLNTALAAFLPLSLKESSSDGLVGIYYPTVSFAQSSISWNLEYLDFTGNKLFVFASVSLPLLILGKIIPKHVGMTNYKFFAYDLNIIARIILRCLGWLAAGTLWIAAPIQNSKR